MQELTDIINKAIPKSTCAQTEANNKARRVWLHKQLNDYIGNQLSQQFNAKPHSIGEPGMEQSPN